MDEDSSRVTTERKLSRASSADLRREAALEAAAAEIERDLIDTACARRFDANPPLARVALAADRGDDGTEEAADDVDDAAHGGDGGDGRGGGGAAVETPPWSSAAFERAFLAGGRLPRDADEAIGAPRVFTHACPVRDGTP